MRHIQEVLKSELVLTAIPASSCLVQSQKEILHHAHATVFT